MDADSKTQILAGTLIFALIYFSPAILAFSRHKRARMIILAISILLFLSSVASIFWLRGLQDYLLVATGAGWLLCMIWVWVGKVEK